MRLNKKGFTLVELLVVLVILVVIMAIAIPSVTSSIERSEQKQKDSKIQLVVSTFEIWVDRNKNSCADGCTRSVKELVCIDNLLTGEQAKDPSNEKYTLSGYVVFDGTNYNWNEVNADQYRVNLESGC